MTVLELLFCVTHQPRTPIDSMEVACFFGIFGPLLAPLTHAPPASDADAAADNSRV